MKKIILSIALVSLLYSCKPTAALQTAEKQEVAVKIDLNNVKEDK